MPQPGSPTQAKYLRQLVGGANQETFGYNQVGNMLSESEGGVSHTMLYQDANHKHAPSSVDGSGQTYDANGNLVASSGLSLQYNTENQLVKVSQGSAYVARFVTDGDGQRRKRIDSFGTVIYAGPHYERNVGTGADTSDVTTKLYWAQLGPLRRLIAVRKGGVLSYLHHDHLGSTKEISGTTGGPMKYYPFGSTYQEISSPPTDSLYTGQKRDLSTGLYFYGARYMNPAIGMFAQPDTTVPDPGNPQSLNRYSYGLSNPLRYVDPSGHDPIDSDWESQFTAAQGKAPTDDDRLDRLYSFSTGRTWTDGDWQQYTAKKQAGTVNPRDLLVGTRGSMNERIKIASALVMLKMSGPRGAAIYNQIVAMGTSIRFGGGLFDDPLTLFRRDGDSIGYDNAIFLEPSLMNDYAEAVAANIAHEAYHTWQPVDRYPFTRREEVQAYTQEAQAWEELRVRYKGSNTMFGNILDAYRNQDLPDYVKAQGIYMRFPYFEY